MSEPQPTSKKGSLRDRIAAFESRATTASTATTPSSPPARPKPNPVVWKPRPPSPPPEGSSSHGSGTAALALAGGMNASDAKESITRAGGLKERMAALQGKGAFGGPQPVAAAKPPLPQGEKPRWRPPPKVVAPSSPLEGEHAEKVRSPEPVVPLSPVDLSSAPVSGDAENKEERREREEADDEANRRAALAARMARLGGARVGLAAPAPLWKKPDVANKPSPPAAATPDVDATATNEDTLAQNKAAPASVHGPPTSMPVPAGPRRAAPPRRKPPVPANRSEEATDAGSGDKVGEEVGKSDFSISEKEEVEKVQKEVGLPESGSGEEGPTANVSEQVAVVSVPSPVIDDVGHMDSPHEGEAIMPSETDAKRDSPIDRPPSDAQSNAALASTAAVSKINEARDITTDVGIFDSSKINEEPSQLSPSEQESKQEQEREKEESAERGVEEGYSKPRKHSAEWLTKIGGVNPLVGLAAPGRSASTDDSVLDVQDPEREEQLESLPVDDAALPITSHSPDHSAPVPEAQDQIHPSSLQMEESLDDSDARAQDEHEDDDDTEVQVENQASGSVNDSDPAPAEQGKGNTTPPLLTNVRSEPPPPPHRSIPLPPSSSLAPEQPVDSDQYQNDEPAPNVGESGEEATATSLMQSQSVDPELHSLAPLRQDSRAEKGTKQQLPALALDDQLREVLDESEGDPIDPAFHSPSGRASPSPHSASVSGRTPEVGATFTPPPVPKQETEQEAEQERRHTIAERMAKLGGIKFGMAPPGPIPRLPQKRQGSASEVVEEDQQESTLAEEDEQARKQRIAAKLAGMGGMRFGMLPPGVGIGTGSPTHRQSAVERDRVSSVGTAGATSSPTSPRPPPAPYRTVQAPFEEYEKSELESLSTSDDGVKVEAEESEPEEVSYSEAGEAEEAPLSNKLPTELTKVSQRAPPPIPVGRPPFLPRQASQESGPPSNTFSYPPKPHQSEYVIVDNTGTAEPEAPPPRPSVPRATPLPPARSAPPPPVAKENLESSQWELPSIPSATIDFGGGTPDLSLSWSEDLVGYSQADSSLDAKSPREPSASSQPTELQLSPGALMSVWGKVGVQICEAATNLHEQSKKSVVGDGSFTGFVRAVFVQVPNAMPLPFEGETYGYLIYAQNGMAVQRRVSEIMPGDVVLLLDAKLKGHKGIQSYQQHVGTTEPVVGIVGEFDAKKSKIKVFQANQHVGHQSVELVSYRLDDLKSGSIKVFRVLEA